MSSCLPCSRALRAIVPSCLSFLHAFLFYVSYVLSLLTCLTCLHFIYKCAKKITQSNENLFTFIKYFHYYKTFVVFCTSFSFSKRKILTILILNEVLFSTRFSTTFSTIFSTIFENIKISILVPFWATIDHKINFTQNTSHSSFISKKLCSPSQMLLETSNFYHIFTRFDSGWCVH